MWFALYDFITNSMKKPIRMAITITSYFHRKHDAKAQLHC